MNLQTFVRSKLLSTWKMFWAHVVTGGGTHSSVTLVTVISLFVNHILILIFFFITTLIPNVLGEPNGNTICCTCVLEVFTTQRTLLNFVISVQRKKHRQ